MTRSSSFRIISSTRLCCDRCSAVVVVLLVSPWVVDLGELDDSRGGGVGERSWLVDWLVFS